MLTELQMSVLILLSAFGLIALLVDGVKKIIKMSLKFALYFLFVLAVVYLIGYV